MCWLDSSTERGEMSHGIEYKMIREDDGFAVYQINHGKPQSDPDHKFLHAKFQGSALGLNAAMNKVDQLNHELRELER